MKKSMKTGAYLLLVVGMTSVLTGCKNDDPDYNQATPPVVAVTHSISGRVTGMDGEGIEATVSMNGTDQATRADGTFLFEDVKAGTYTVKAQATGKISKEENLTVPENGNGANLVWNATLMNAGKEVKVNADGSAEARVTSETIKGNESGEVEVNLTAPAGAVPAGNSIIITPVYSLGDALVKTKAEGSIKRAAESVMLIGTDVACSNSSVALEQPVTLEYEVDPEVAAGITARKYVDGQWVEADYAVEGDKVTIRADRFTSYSLLFGAEISSSTTTEAIRFSQEIWNNLYESGDMSVDAASFAYKIGAEINASGTDRITAYLIEVLARMSGASVTAATGSYPLNVTLPVGTALNISGRQEVKSLTVSALNRSVSGKQYGNVSIVPKTYTRDHNGGTN